MSDDQKNIDLERIAREYGLSVDPCIDYEQLYKDLDAKQAELARIRRPGLRLVWSNGHVANEAITIR